MNRRIALGWIPAIMLFVTGNVLHISAYWSIAPLTASLLFAIIGYMLVRFGLRGDSAERAGYMLLFSAYWCAAGLAVIFSTYFGDHPHNSSDAELFYQFSTGVEEAPPYMDAFLMVRVWSWVYKALGRIGFEPASYLGILVNILIVAVSGVILLKSAKRMYANTESRVPLLLFLLSGCGLLWLFASSHLRDAGVYLAVTGGVYLWIRVLSRPTFGNVVLAVAGNVAFYSSLMALRAEFAFVPLAMLMAAVASMLVFSRLRGIYKLMSWGLCVLAVVIGAWMVVARYEQAADVASRSREGYSELSSEQSDDGSLGVRFVVNQPMPIRVIAGTGYLMVFPIPFWNGLISGSAYQFFKSANAVLFYGIIPLLALAFWKLVRDSRVRTPASVFLLFCVVGFSAAVAATSLETRHFGAFLGPLFLLAILPDFTTNADRDRYRWFLLFFLSGIGAVHVLWVVLKFGVL